jgi:hypothetical protein
LPFFYISLPPWFKEKHPRIVQNLITNKNRLTTPYDLHMTLKHIIELSGSTEKLPQSLSCPKAQSLFEAVPWNRSCDDACVEFHFCTCSAYTLMDLKDEMGLKARRFAVEWMNKELQLKARKDDKPLCATLKLGNIGRGEKSAAVNANTSNEFMHYLVNFDVVPSNASFETTVTFYTQNSEFKISGDISRINAYGNQSHCVGDAKLKLYCYCLDLIENGMEFSDKTTLLTSTEPKTITSDHSNKTTEENIANNTKS